MYRRLGIDVVKRDRYTQLAPVDPGDNADFHVEEPVLDAKEGGNLAACHYPMTDDEIARRVPTAAVE